MSMSSSFKLI